MENAKKYSLVLNNKYFQHQDAHGEDGAKGLVDPKMLKGTDLLSVQACHAAMQGQKNLFINPVQVLGSKDVDPAECANPDHLKKLLPDVIE